ncbi:MAG: hypothetical protein Q7R30_00280 [Acidobacteriota bacterium]|nr:hypothetical protein [Acidobacteriota bacterium]
MNDTIHIENETLVAYIYDEVDAPEKARVARHLQQCATCGAEYAALTGVRTVLQAWAPPHAGLGFTVVPRTEAEQSARVLRPAPWWNTVPVWAQAVAAILVLAVSAAVANIQVRSGADGFAVTTGWMSQSASARERTSELPRDPADLSAGASAKAEAAIGREGGAAATRAPVATASVTGAEDWKAALVSLEQQLRNEIRTSRSADAVVRTSSRPSADEATIRRVQELLAASEARQERQLALRLTQFNRDVNVQRQADLVRIQQLFGHSEGEISKQRQMLNYVMRASAPQQ